MDEIFNLFWSPYTGSLGNYAYLIVGGIVLVGIYNKSESTAGPTLLGIIISAAFASYLPGNALVAVLMLLVTGACSMVYSTANREGY